MQRDLELDTLQHEQIDHWLKLWWSLADHGSYGRGYPSRAAGTAMYRASRQRDDWNGALEDDSDRNEAGAVGEVVDSLQEPYHSALHMEARCLSSQHVWRSARVDQANAERIIAEARMMLWVGMVKRGLDKG